MEWRSIPGLEGRYEVSEKGQVRSVASADPHARRRGAVLSAPMTNRGYRHFIALDAEGKRRTMHVHTAVALAFCGPRPEGAMVRHLDGDRANNAARNLAWGTRSENMLDSVEHGTHRNAAKTHCLRGHDLAVDGVVRNGQRECKACRRVRYMAQRDARSAT